MGNNRSKFEQLQHELNDLFKKAFGPDPFGTGFDPERWERWSPKADLYKKAGQWVVRVELPEVNPNDVSVSASENRLLIEGERKPPEGFNPEESIFQECPHGAFERVVVLPSPILEDQIQATYRQGVLYITFPITEAKEKKIKIKSEEPPEEMAEEAAAEAA